MPSSTLPCPSPTRLLACLLACLAACATGGADALPGATPPIGAAEAAAPLSWRSLPPRPRAHAPLLLELADGPCTAIDDIRRSARTVTVRLSTRTGCDAAAAPPLLRTDQGSARWGSGGVHRLRIEDAAGPGGSARLRAFALVPVGATRSDTWPEAGFWWNETGGEFDSGGPGIGLQMERQGDTLSVSVLGYASDGRPEWLIGAGPVAEGVARVPLLRLGDGGGPFGGFRAPAEASGAGVLHLEFHSAARATAWFERAQPDGSLQLTPMSLVRFRFDHGHEEALQGPWLLMVAGEPEPRLLQLGAAEPTEGGVRLPALADGEWMDCTLDRQRPNSPPHRCVLRAADGELLVDFSDVALDQMRGWRPDGSAVTALRRRD